MVVRRGDVNVCNVGGGVGVGVCGGGVGVCCGACCVVWQRGA